MIKKHQKELFSIFLFIAFPIHLWAILQIFSNYEWIVLRTAQQWDGISYAAYTLSFALFETAVLFLISVPLYLMLRKNREWKTATTIFCMLFFVTAVLMIAIQENSRNHLIYQTTIFDFLARFNLRFRYELVILFILTTSLVTISLVLPLKIIQHRKVKEIFVNFLQRLEILSYLYLFIDIIGIGIVITRNLFL